MANLDYLSQMADAIEERGGNVFFAEHGEDVVRYIGDLAQARGEDTHQVQEHGDRGDRAEPPSGRRRGPRAGDSGDRPGRVDRPARRRHRTSSDPSCT